MIQPLLFRRLRRLPRRPHEPLAHDFVGSIRRPLRSWRRHVSSRRRTVHVHVRRNHDVTSATRWYVASQRVKFERSYGYFRAGPVGPEELELVASYGTTSSSSFQKRPTRGIFATCTFVSALRMTA